VTFAQVNTAGITSFNSIPPASAGSVPNGYVINGSSIAFDVSTTAVFAPPVDLCFTLPAVNDAAAFGELSVLHNEGGTLIDRTVSRDFAMKKICARVNSLSPFTVASQVTVQFSASTYSVQEDCTFVTITVNRGGDTSGAANVDYTTSDQVATERKDYIKALGNLRFAAGETSKTFVVLINEDSFAEGNETLNINLSNPLGAGLSAPASATITITDDAVEPAGNVIDEARNYVCQNYHDFLNRQPDASGWDFWTNEITSCGGNAQCIEVRRINVSASFFLSIEFQQTGYLVERSYKTAYGDVDGTSTFPTAHSLTVPIIRSNEFLADTQQITKGVVVLQPGWEQQLEANKVAFFNEFVLRLRFTDAFPTSMTPAQFVDQLNQRAGNVLSASERQTAIDLFGGAGTTTNNPARAQALRQVAEDQDLVNAEFNRAFVLMQYFGYLRRNPNDPQDTDHTGYDFWLVKLNQFGGNYISAEMVKAFITSIEYGQRFGP